MEDSKGKIDGIYRDPNPDVTRKQITLTIFKKLKLLAEILLIRLQEKLPLLKMVVKMKIDLTLFY